MPSLDSSSMLGQACTFASGVWNGIKGQGKSKASEESHEHHTETHDPAPENDVEEVGSRKRRQLSHVEVPAWSKRQDRRSEHARRLEGDFVIPPDAQPISVPQTFSGKELDWRAGGRMSRTKPGAGRRVFTIRDTLNQSSQAASLEATHPRFKPRTTSIPDTPDLDASTLALGVNGHGDVYAGAESGHRAAKKRKIGPSARGELTSDPIDVDEDDRGLTKVTKVNNRPVRSVGPEKQAQRGATSSPAAHFAPRELDNVNRLTETGHKKARRKHANGYSSSQTSSRESPTATTNRLPRRIPQSQSEVISIDDDTSQEISQSRTTRKESDATNDLPSINLTKGMDNAPLKQRKRESPDSVQYSHTNLRPQMPPPSTEGSHARKVPQQASLQKRRTISQDNLTQDYLQDKRLRREGEGRLCQKFVRDDSTARLQAEQGTSRRAVMKASSADAPRQRATVDDSFSSVDELSGPKTIGSISPEKSVAAPTANSRMRTKSPSDLPPTKWTSSKREHSPRGSTPVRAPPVDQSVYNKLHVQVREFSATSCCLREEDITMRFHPRDRELTVELKGQPVVVTGEKCFVHVSSTEAGEVIFDPSSSLVYLKGSSGPISNGHVCISFQDMDSKTWFLRKLGLVCTVKPNFTEKPPGEMQKIFATQVRDIRKAARMRMSVAERNRALEEMVAAKGARSLQQDDDERIKYETDEPEHPNRREGMMSAVIEASPEGPTNTRLPKVLEKSRFFHDSTPRRSTRQSKPVKRSPSPPPLERWTQIHKPARWTHSVVYPPEGARRVTVDFQDLERLDEGEFLNDNVISFALRRIEEKMAPEHKERVHFFNSFFYTALTTKNGKKAFNYDAVKRWTKSKDVFGCDYVVVPINIDLHWFVAIVCNLPNLSRRVAGPDDEDNEGNEGGCHGEDATSEKDQQVSFDAVEPPSSAGGRQNGGETSDNTKAMYKLSLSDGDDSSTVAHRAHNEHAESSLDTAELGKEVSAAAKMTPVQASGRRGKKREHRPPSYDPDTPAIITLDSFGTGHTAEIRYLKDYLIAEGEAKRGMIVDTKQFQGVNANKSEGIPTQTNYCDCGVYLVGYVEQFAKNPREFVTRALQRTLGYEGEFAGFDPSTKRDEIREELLHLQKKQEDDHRAKKAGKKVTKAGEQAASSTVTTPKPESVPASKAPSPAVDTKKPIACGDGPYERSAAPPTANDESVAQAQAQASQADDLDLAVPRALHGSSHSDQYITQPQRKEDDSELEEMLDDPEGRPVHAEQRATHGPGPNQLLDELSAEVTGSTRPSNLAVQLQEAAAERSDVEGPEEVRPNIPANPRHEGAGPNKPLEIADSQERSQRPGANVFPTWCGTRTSFD